ncbi:uncharacterized protein PAC_18429 [Phialocephala subalpina]|uniref:Uncharacterized protein n=1 Tax=Phialocephala subalpina TaxID=576137 RepID=A0A1L7XU25_9HELO|nr:uncharacterized protein PAC_18429 [Phialocephala subalpina]
MSGLEIPALIAGVVGAVASGASAYKDVTKRGGGEQSLYKSERITQSGNTIQRTTDVVYSSGTGRASLSANGDMVASSSGARSSAVAYSKWESAQVWKTDTGYEQSSKRGYKK